MTSVTKWLAASHQPPRPSWLAVSRSWLTVASLQSPPWGSEGGRWQVPVTHGRRTRWQYSTVCRATWEVARSNRQVSNCYSHRTPKHSFAEYSLKGTFVRRMDNEDRVMTDDVQCWRRSSLVLSLLVTASLTLHFVINSTVHSHCTRQKSDLHIVAVGTKPRDIFDQIHFFA